MNRVLLAAIALATHAALADDLPTPPIPPDRLPFGETAPVPDPDVSAPTGPASENPSLAVKLYRAQPYDPGLGFTPGSRYRSAEDRKPIQTPGLSVSVPLR